MNVASRRPRLRERLREEAGRAILAAAEEVFAEQGLAGARMEQVAARAGVAVGTLYNHFRDRDALLAAVRRSRREALLARVDDALARTRGEPVEPRLRAFAAAVLEHGREHGRFLAALVQAGEGPARGTRPGESLVAALVSRAEGVLAEARRRGEVRPGGPAQALAFVALTRAALLHALEAPGGDDEAAAMVELFLRGAGA
jgi:AcrR family transcriptional regulator